MYTARQSLHYATATAYWNHLSLLELTCSQKLKKNSIHKFIIIKEINQQIICNSITRYYHNGKLTNNNNRLHYFHDCALQFLFYSRLLVYFKWKYKLNAWCLFIYTIIIMYCKFLNKCKELIYIRIKLQETQSSQRF